MCKGLFSWENTGKIGNLWNFDAWSQILTGKAHGTTTPLYENHPLAHRHQFSISLFFFSPCVRVFFPEKTQGKCVIGDILMCEAKSWQAKHVILPHHYMKIKPWLTGINGKCLCLCFTICKGLFYWENPWKLDTLWNFDVWSQILTGKMCATTKKIYENQASTHRHQFYISIFFLFHHVQGFCFLWKHRKDR
jgi:hypothetical protein